MDKREQIARIIAPDDWAEYDHAPARTGTIDWVAWAAQRVSRSLAKADAILALDDWRPMSEALPDGGPILMCQPGATDHWAVVIWCEGEGPGDFPDPDDNDAGQLAWRDNCFGHIFATDESIAAAHIPAMWKPVTPCPGSLSYLPPKDKTDD